MKAEQNAVQSGQAVRKYTGSAHSIETALLVKRAQAGDKTAFARLVEPHMLQAYRVALKITRNKEDAEDASQQALLKGFANIGKFQGASQFSTWLTRIVMNEALMVLRKRRSENAHICYESDSDEGTSPVELLRGEDGLQPEILFTRSENKRKLREAIGGLRGTLRDVVCLLGLEERQNKEVAQALNLSQSALKARFFRARQELRECLGGQI